MKDLLDRLHKALGTLAETDTEASTEGPEDMTAEAFTVYVTEELEKAAKDSPETKVLRLTALKAQIEALAKNFEGRPSTPGGILRVTRFKDPGQVTTTEKTIPPKNATPTTQFTTGPETHPPGTATTPPGGKMPPLTAGGSGFDNPATATFAKALEGLDDAIAKLGGKTDEEIAKAKADAKAKAAKAAKVAKANEGKSPEEIAKAKVDADAKVKAEAEKVAKAKASEAFWPLDMNTDFGRGETDDPDVPEWGLDDGTMPAVKKPDTANAAE